MQQIEYRVRPVTRYVVTRYEDAGPNGTANIRGLGEYDNQQVAQEVGYALCRAEHEHLGWPPGDCRILYPQPIHGSESAILQSPALTSEKIQGDRAND